MSALWIHRIGSGSVHGASEPNDTIMPLSANVLMRVEAGCALYGHLDAVFLADGYACFGREAVVDDAVSVVFARVVAEGGLEGSCCLVEGFVADCVELDL